MPKPRTPRARFEAKKIPLGEALAFPRLCQTLRSPGVAFPRPPTTGFFHNRACIWRGVGVGWGLGRGAAAEPSVSRPLSPGNPEAVKKGATRWGVGRVTWFTRCGGRVRGRGAAGSKRWWQARVSAAGAASKENAGGKGAEPAAGSPQTG